MDILESQQADFAWNKWHLKLWDKMSCISYKITLDWDILESQQADLAWNKWDFSLFETNCHALAINYLSVGHVWVTTCRFSMK